MAHTDTTDLADFRRTRAHLEALLGTPAHRTEALYLLWEVCQACGDPESALRYLDEAIRRNPVHSRLRTGDTVDRTILAIARAGDFQANLPVNFLFDQKTALHTLWLPDPGDSPACLELELPDALPDFDCIFITIAQDNRHVAALELADRLAEQLQKPIINRGAKISRLSRDGAARLLSEVSDAVVPRQCLRDKTELLTAPKWETSIVRPISSHAGHGLARIDTQPELAQYLLGACSSDAFYVAPFIDFRSLDGHYRKYRIVFIEGVPYPVHLAIHDDWKVWYYNSRMDRDAWKRAEEERFLADLPGAMGEPATQALSAIGQALDLDYVGLDCSVLADGRLLVFEIETGMIVHDKDSAPEFAYKKQYMRNIFAALEHMIDTRIGSVRA